MNTTTVLNTRIFHITVYKRCTSKMIVMIGTNAYQVPRQKIGWYLRIIERMIINRNFLSMQLEWMWHNLPYLWQFRLRNLRVSLCCLWPQGLGVFYRLDCWNHADDHLSICFLTLHISDWFHQIRNEWKVPAPSSWLKYAYVCQWNWVFSFQNPILYVEARNFGYLSAVFQFPRTRMYIWLLFIAWVRGRDIMKCPRPRSQQY